MKYFIFSFVFLSLFLLTGCSDTIGSPGKGSSVDNENLEFGTLVDLTSEELVNPVPYITPQCYTNPIDGDNVYNPCYACHTESRSPNFLNDTDVQSEFVFPEPGVINRWSNLFKDRRQDVANISDDEISSYVQENNYFTDSGDIIIAKKLNDLPVEWDRNKNGIWDGFVPDSYFNFDSEGFDRNKEGDYTGWRVYAYYPFPGTFMPTNGSTDDVMIRLPEAFRKTVDGEFDYGIYKINLAIVEAMMKKRSVRITPVDEKSLGVDLNKDGILDIADEVVYDWQPLEGRNMSYVGQAKERLKAGEIHIAAGLMPEGTEFLHSVRYLSTENGTVSMAPRMKELRYARKDGWRNYFQLRRIVEKEIKERHDFPERTKIVIGNMETGLQVPHGWTYQGFIEDDAGQLRPQTYEETYFCVGCHGYTGASNDTTISFLRKFDTSEHQQGWYHWMQKSFKGVSDPDRKDGQGEYSYYLEKNPTGNEYRTNDEVYNKFFTMDGLKKQHAFDRLRKDISYLLMPSVERAKKLNKSYRVIVQEQSYIYGREGVVTPLKNVHREVEINQATGITDILSHY